MYFNNLLATEYTYSSSQQSALKTKINGALQPGDIVYLENGTYSNCLLLFKGEGTENKPITLKAKNPGKVIFNGQVKLQISGQYLVVDGLVFKDGIAVNSDLVEFRTSSTVLANNCRITNCVIDNCNNTSLDKNSEKPSERWVMLYGKNNRVDHCYFANKDRSGVLMMVALDKAESRENNHIIDYNFFGYREIFPAGNGGEIIRLGDSSTSIYSCKTIVENNIFFQCDGEVEIISIKSADNIIRQNNFYECAGSVVCRHGKNNTIHSNVFIGNNKAGCGGVRVINQGQKVYDNYFQELAGTGNRSALCIMMAVFENPTLSTDTEQEPLNAYHKVKDAEVASNVFVSCKNVDLGTDVSYTYDSSNRYYPGEKVPGTLKPECLISRNIFYSSGGKSIINKVKSNASEIRLIDNTDKLLSEFDLKKLSFSVPKPDNCGTNWYAGQQYDLNCISGTTDFWKKISSEIKKNNINSSVSIVKKPNTIEISSGIFIEKFFVYNVYGQKVISDILVQSNSGSINCRNFPAGTYIFCIQTSAGLISKKLLIP